MPPKRRHPPSLPNSRASTPSNAEGSLSDIEADIVGGSTPKKRKSLVTSQVKSTKKQKTHESDSNAIASSLPHSSSMHIIGSIQPMRSALLKWFADVRDLRGMPWRKPYDPSLEPDGRAQRAYEVWISEIMLQQTQVATVIPYYNNWMKRFPTLPTLASANIDEVNALWKGLGYYSRASRLLAGAQKAVQSYGGKLPDNAHDLEKNIPGIGRYSAGAISSIAYGERAPVLDGNVHRLLSRLLALYASPKSKATLDILWAGAEAFVQIEEKTNNNNCPSEDDRSGLESQYPGDINQALIEFGSTVCTVRSPKCEACPLQNWCMAYKRSSNVDEEIIDLEDVCKVCETMILDISDVTLYPMKPIRTKAREESDIVNVVEWRSGEDLRNRLFLLMRRPEKGLLAGLFEFLTSENVSKAISKKAKEQLAFNLLKSLFDSPLLLPTANMKKLDDKSNHPKIIKIVPAGAITHVFSHLKKTYHAQWIVVEGGLSPPVLKNNEMNNVKWIALDEVEKANIGTGTSKIWNTIKSLWT